MRVMAKVRVVCWIGFRIGVSARVGRVSTRVGAKVPVLVRVGSHC